MTFRPLFAPFGLAFLASTLTVGCVQGQEEKSAAKAQKPQGSAEAQVQAALEASNDSLPKAIAMLEATVKQYPEDRQAIYLLAAMSCVRAEQSEDKAERIKLFHKSTAEFAKLSKLYPMPTPYERNFGARGRIGEARALALEGKAAEALALIKTSLDAGYEDFDTLEGEKDLEAARKLPEFKAMIAKAVQAGVAQEMANARSFPFDFELKDVDDKTVTLADSKGKVTIVDIWGTWCPPCRKEIPHFVEIYKELKPKGLEIVGINCNEEGSLDEVKKTIKDFARAYKVDYPCVINDEKTETKVPGFSGYPTTLFIDRTGKVRLTLVGYTPKAKLEAIVNILLAEPAAK